jgi:hypothetical protein
MDLSVPEHSNIQSYPSEFQHFPRGQLQENTLPELEGEAYKGHGGFGHGWFGDFRVGSPVTYFELLSLTTKHNATVLTGDQMD